MKKSSKKFAYQEKSITATYLRGRRNKELFSPVFGRCTRGNDNSYSNFDKSVDFLKSLNNILFCSLLNHPLFCLKANPIVRAGVCLHGTHRSTERLIDYIFHLHMPST